VSFFVLGLALAAWAGRHALKPGVVALVGLVGIGASAAGFVFARQTAPPTSAQVIQQVQQQNQGKTQFDLLLESPMLADVKADLSGAAYYIFVYDPDCHTCEMMKPRIEQLRAQYEEQQDPVLRVRMLSVPDIKQNTGLESDMWSPTPTVFFVRLGEAVRDGADVRRYSGNKAIFPDEAYDRLMGEFNTLMQQGKIPG
jgi:thiol-disulfide isomerase/thioredoxin